MYVHNLWFANYLSPNIFMSEKVIVVIHRRYIVNAASKLPALDVKHKPQFSMYVSSSLHEIKDIISRR